MLPGRRWCTEVDTITRHGPGMPISPNLKPGVLTLIMIPTPDSGDTMTSFMAASAVGLDLRGAMEDGGEIIEAKDGAAIDGGAKVVI